MFQPPELTSLPEDDSAKNSLALLLLGLVVTSDWISSDDGNFKYASPEIDVHEYVSCVNQVAAQSIKRLGFAGWQPQGISVPFGQQFAHREISEPNPIQATVIAQCQDTPLPAMVILEAPTGIGKTEAALYVADTWLEQADGRGLYVAMPTTATSNQMFSRTAEYLQHRYPGALVNIQLVHGQVLLDDAFTAMKLAQIDEDDSGRVAAMSWFTARKRSLLAPFGVGTVDQVFLGVLQSRFFFLRLFGLEGKVVIFDEVHAYDTYMSTLLYRLLGWLHAIGTSVIILSATLPDSIRRELIQAYTGTQPSGDQAAVPAYPRVTVCSGTSQTVTSLPTKPGESRALNLRWIESDPAAIIQFLQTSLQDGGCAAVICNTVSRAQAVYQAIKNALLVEPEDCHLFHARFPYDWRHATEKTILDQFSRNGIRPKKSIVVATQVIEQSLDLDFDIMVSDLAPVDLIIQRAGRLHRHAHHSRPTGLSSATLALSKPENNTRNDPDFGPSEYIYAPYILDRTWLTLRDRQSIQIPEETSPLIEAVYGDGVISGVTVDEQTRLQSELQKMESKDTQAIASARNRRIGEPDDESFFTSGTMGLEEDHPDLHASMQALTRADTPGITVICLHQLPDGTLVAEPGDPTSILDLEIDPTTDTLKRLLRCAIQVNRRDLVAWLSRQSIPDSWKKSASLRHCRLLVFVNGECQLSGTPLVLYLSRELGLLVEKEV